MHLAFLANPDGALSLGIGKTWLVQFPPNPGVYCIYLGNELVYAGETGSLKGRMRDLLDTRNHTFRRQFGSVQFGTHHSYQAASSRTKFPDEIEVLLTDFMLKQLKVKAVPVTLGRKEIEERLIDDVKPRYNIKGKRGEVLNASVL